LRLPLTGPTLRPAEILPFEPPQAENLELLVAQALLRRPEPEQARLAVQVLELQGRVAENALLPSLDLVGEVRASRVRQDLYDWRVGLEVEFPLGNHLARGQYERNRWLLQQVRLLAEDQQQAVILEVSQALRAVEEDARRAVFSRQARVDAEQRLEAELERFRSGLGTAHLVNFAEQQLIGVQQIEVGALVDFQISRVNLRRALGTTLDDYGISVGQWPAAENPPEPQP
ncbi:MAG: TolC family protein, partial [Candidatus Eremiobacterota bacterium]